jgi:hypothetical protein
MITGRTVPAGDATRDAEALDRRGLPHFGSRA